MTARVKKEISSGWDAYYRGYQMALARRYLVPTLQRWGVDLRGRRLLEVGCGDGGCGAVFSEAGCRVVMMDIEERLVSLARKVNEKEGVAAKIFTGDVFDEHAEFYREGPFDIVMFRDVMEHLADPVRALRIVKDHLAPGGLVFVVFPPYYSPYGAHQQILPRKRFGPLPYNKVPYIQLLPSSWFLRLVHGDDEQSREVARLHSIRLTIRGFERAVEAAGLLVQRRQPYLSRPTFALRYGAPVIKASVLGRTPILKEVLVTAAYYLLGLPEPD